MKTNGKFGVLFDIDGVLLRGKTVIPSAKKAIEKLMDKEKNEFVVPTLFCTNGFGLKEVKAETLSRLLQCKISPNQMVMSQSPLEMFTDFHDKVCLISGPEHDGGSIAVARSLGFRNAVTIDQLRTAYPYLDWVDRKRWPDRELANDEDFPKIEAVVLLGEPVRWETNLQLIIDVIRTHGRPAKAASPDSEDEHDQLPVLAVNLDLLWMAKAAQPRFGHGAFLLCLEALYEKITGRKLKYEALVGKPSIVTYQYSKLLLEDFARKMDMPKLDKIYAIGDNPLTDIYGANVFDRYLAAEREANKERESEEKELMEVDKVVIERCASILVCTGVYQPPHRDSCETSEKVRERKQLDHGHRDLPFCSQLTRADSIVEDVNDAINEICKLEDWEPVQ